MNPTQPPDPHQARLGDGIHLHAHASGEARVHQAARDQHFHYVDGVRDQRRTLPGTLVRECPYPGLAPFEPSQAKWFFGRDGLIAELISRLDQRLHTGGIQTVIAPSGAGKSSLLRAGLLPKLDQAVLPGSDQWPKLLITPTANPLQVLTDHIAPLIPANAAVLTEQLEADPHRCTPLLARALRERLRGKDPHARVVVVVDQFEELFTQCANGQQRRIFIDVLAHLASDHATFSQDTKPVGLVVAGIRADFYASCADHPPLRAALQNAPLLVGPMSNSELREAILFPARDVDLDLEPGLVELLLRDINATAGIDTGASYEAGRLPLLAHALRVSWHQRHGSTLTVQGYLRSGGIQHAIATTADQVYANLDDIEKRVAQSLFLRLTKIGDRTQDTRRQLSRAELITTSANPSRIAAVVDAFTHARLLTQQQDTLEITHDALLYSWPQLRHWIDTDRAGQLTRQRLEGAADAWEREGRHPDTLYRGPRLVGAREWFDTAESRTELSPLGREFLTASNQHEEERRLVGRRRARRQRQLITLMTVVTVLAMVATTIAVISLGAMQKRANSAIADRVGGFARGTRSTDTAISAQLALAAYQLSPGIGARSALIGTFSSPYVTPVIGHKGDIQSAVFSPDGRVMASGSDDRTVRLWDATNSHLPTSLSTITDHRSVVTSVAFSPDGHLLASGGQDGALRLWDVTNPNQPGLLCTIAAHNGAVESVAFDPSGHMIATGNRDRTVRLWGIANVHQPTPLSTITDHRGMVTSVAFSPDGHHLATASQDETVRLWDINNRGQSSPMATLTERHGAVNSVAFSPDGRTLASASADRTVRLWDLANPHQPGLLGANPSHVGAVRFVAFHPNGHILASGGADRTIKLFDLTGPVLRRHTDQVHSVAFSPNGRVLATGSDDKTIGLWDATNPYQPVPLSTLLGHTLTIKKVVFSPNGRILASGSDDRTVRLWDVNYPRQPVPLAVLASHTDFVPAISFHPDGRIIASGSDDRTVRLWDVNNPRQPTPLSTITDHEGVVYSVGFSPDGHILATASADRTVRLWDVIDPRHPKPLSTLRAHLDIVTALAFRPDGKTLSTGSLDKTVRLWNIENPRTPEPLSLPTDVNDRVASLAYSPDGHTLVAGQHDGSLRLWNVTNSRKPEFLAFLSGHTRWVTSVVFNRDGHTLASGSGDHTGRLWDIDTDRLTRRICEVTRHADPAARIEWEKHFPNDDYNPPCQE